MQHYISSSGKSTDWSHNSPVTALYNGGHCVAVHSVHHHMLHISIAQNATARTKSWTELRCIAILQLHSIEDQCASILVDLEKAVRRPAPGALLQWWQCGGVAVWQSTSVALMWET